MKGKVISLNPDSFVQGGLISDADVKLKMRFCSWDYGGSVTNPVLAVKGELTPLEGGEALEQYWSAGSLSEFYPSDDGKTLIANGDKEHLVLSSNFALFVASLTRAGLDGTVLDPGDLSVLDDIEIHVFRDKAPTRQGLSQQVKEGGREATLLLCTKILKLPWEKKGAKGKPAAKAAAAAAGASAPAATAINGEADDETLAALIDAMGTETTVSVQTLKTSLFRSLAKNPRRTEMVKMAVDPEWLAKSGFVIDGGQVKQSVQ